MTTTKLSPAAANALRAAGRGALFHSVYGGYDWHTLDEMNPQRCTGQVRKLLRLGLVELLPRRAGDEHRGQSYRLTGDGAAELAKYDENPEEG